MAFYQFYEEQLINATLDEVWNFISSPGNLKSITPKYMGFEIINPLPINLNKMHEGMIICYSVKPLPFFKTKWVTEITHVKEKVFFIDEQRIGPYSMWHHQHWVEETEKGVLMKDIVTYQPPFGIIGEMANTLIIKNKLREIFDFRKIAIEKKFLNKEF